MRLVFDHQHFFCLNPERLELLPTLRQFLRTWPEGVRPKLHFSCPRTEMRELKRKNKKTGKIERVLQSPVWTGHADFNSPFETISFLRSIRELDVDVMLEAKMKDLALLRLRNDLAKYAPDLAGRYGIDKAQAGEDSPEFIAAMDGEE